MRRAGRPRGRASAALIEATRAAAALPGEGWSGRIAPPDGEVNPIGPVEAFLVAVLEQLRARAAPSEVGHGVRGAAGARPGARDGRGRGRRGAGRDRGAAAGPGPRSWRTCSTRRPTTLTTGGPGAHRRGAARARPPRADDAAGLALDAAGHRRGRRGRSRTSSTGSTPTFLYGRVVDAACRRHWVDPTEPLHRGGDRPGARGAGDQRHPGRPDAGRSLRPGRDAHRRGAAARPAQDPAARLALRLCRQRPRLRGHRRRPRRSAPGGRGHARAVPGRRRRRARPVHRHPPAARGARADRRARWPTRGWRSTPSTSIRWRSGALVDIFRAEEDACLLGTDAVRDGVDVPGRSLRLLVFDRVPWPRPDILHKARRARFGGKGYDDAVARGRIAQAFGRLIRRADDKGVFVMLDAAAPTRLFSGLPKGCAPAGGPGRGDRGGRRALEDAGELSPFSDR